MYCVPLIPSMSPAYSSALTYAAQLCEIAKEVQRITEEVQKLPGVTTEYVQEYVQSQLLPVQNQLDELSLSVDVRFSAQTSLLQQRVDELRAYADTQSAQVYLNATSYTNEAELTLTRRIDSTLAQGGTVRSPISGDVVTVQQALNELAGLHQSGISASSFDALELTAQGFDSKNLTAYNFDYSGIPA